MSQGTFITITIGNVLSLIVFLLIYRESKKILRSHTYVLGEKCKKIIDDWEGKALNIMYGLTLLGLIGFSYYLFSSY